MTLEELRKEVPEMENYLKIYAEGAGTALLDPGV